MFSKFGMNPKNFKHVKSDKDKTILRHKDGHEVTVAHNVLSKDMQKVLRSMAPNEKEKKDPYGKVTIKEDKKQALGKVDVRDDIYKSKRLTEGPDQDDSEQYAEGGKVEKIERVDKEKAKGMVKGALSGGPTIAEGLQNIKKGLGFAEGGRVKYAEGDEIIEETPFQQDLNAPSILDSLRSNIPELRQENIAQVDPYLAVDEAIDKEAKSKEQIDQVAKEQQAQAQLEAQQGLAEREPSANAGLAAGAQPAPPIVPEDTSLNQLNRSMAQENKAYDDEAKAVSKLAEAKNEILLQKQVEFDDIAKAQQAARLDMEQTAKGLESDIKNGYINPDKYWTGYTAPNGEKVPGHSRLAAGIGMIIAGFNPTSNPNAVMQSIDKGIDNSIKAQAQNLDSSHNLLRANLEKYKNKADALTATKLMLMEDVNRRVEMAANNSAGPMAKAQAEKFKAQNIQKMLPLIKQLQDSQTLANLSKDPSKTGAYLTALERIDPKKASDLRERLVPGVGFANTKEDADYLKIVEDRRSNIKTNSEKALNIIKKSGTYEALGPHNAQIDTLAEQIATDQAKLIDPTSIARPNEVEAVKKNLVTAGLFQQNKTAQANLQKFYDTVESRAQQAYKVRGMSGSSKPLSGTGTDPVRGKDGKMYIKDPSGKFMIPYKGQ